MVKLGLLLLLMICVHASLAGWLKSSKRNWVKSVSRGDKHPWEIFSEEKPAEGHVDREDREETFDMIMSRMVKKALKPLLDLVGKVLGVGPERPSFCRTYECPDFKVLNKTQNYELRLYQPSRWVSTSMQGKNMKGKKSCFWRLFEYIRGNNDREEKIDMTVPVTNVIKKDPATEMINATMSFYLSPSIDNPPRPNDDEVWIQRKESFKVYVHIFGGYVMSLRTWEKEAKNLQDMLDRDGLSGTYYTPDVKFVTAGYNDPMQLFNRHNEVWLIAKDKEA